MPTLRPFACLSAVLLLASPALADEEVQSGRLSGGGGPVIEHEIELTRFDTKGDARVLERVELDFLTATIGGYTTDGSGIPVEIYTEMSADYALDGTTIAETEALVNFVVPNTGPGSFSVFDNDTASVVLTDDADLAPWIGDGIRIMDAATQLTVWSDPEDVIDFGAGGSVQYTVTYVFSIVEACPADLDGSGVVGFDDLLAVLADWGPCAGCPGDLDGDGTVGFPDLLATLAAWGPCP